MSKILSELLCFFGFGKKSAPAPAPVAIAHVKPATTGVSVEAALADHLTRHECKFSTSSDYYYRYESRSGWSRYFTTPFEITCRNKNSGDLAQSPEYAKNVLATGNDRAFYLYSTYAHALKQIGRRLDPTWEEHFDEHDSFELVCLARFKKSAPALLNRPPHPDNSVNTSVGSFYILPDAERFVIPDEYIDVYIGGKWVPKSPEVGDLLVKLKDRLPYKAFVSLLTPTSLTVPAHTAVV